MLRLQFSLIIALIPPIDGRLNSITRETYFSKRKRFSQEDIEKKNISALIEVDVQHVRKEIEKRLLRCVTLHEWILNYGNH